jgi:hypothetical protein
MITSEISSSISLNSEMSSYTVNVSGFGKLVERELNSYLKTLSRLGLLTCSVGSCKSAVASGIAVEKNVKKSGRPKKVVRKASDDDIIADLTAKANPSKAKKSKNVKMTDEEKSSKAAAKQALKEEKAATKAVAKAEEKAKKSLLKAKLAEEKAVCKRLEKEAKGLAKAQAKAEKMAKKVAEKEAKKAAKAAEKEAKTAAKNALKEKKVQEAKAKLAQKAKEAKEQEAKIKAQEKDLVEETYEDSGDDIINPAGEIVGNKTTGFVVPLTPAEIKINQAIKNAGLKAFTHDSLPDDNLYIDDDNSVFKLISAAEDGKPSVDHIAEFYPETGILVIASESQSDSDDESDTDAQNLYLSDTE